MVASRTESAGLAESAAVKSWLVGSSRLRYTQPTLGGLVSSRVHGMRSEIGMARRVTTHLMFEGVAEEAMNFYVSLLGGSEIKQIERYGPGELGPEGTVKLAAFTLAGREFLCIDSPIKHEFTFTPSMSLFVDCESAAELDEAFGRLSDGGVVLMPVDNYGFSTRFGWVKDRFGVSWQLNLP
jgi:predicted 3-demethylubiquinone-9 3-methyltransferase (glyoxalase superfamily)